jgi:hypothetical protein
MQMPHLSAAEVAEACGVRGEILKMALFEPISANLDRCALGKLLRRV